MAWFFLPSSLLKGEIFFLELETETFQAKNRAYKIECWPTN